MTRQTWTTNDQKQWLDARKSAFLESKQKDLTLKEFFPLVVREFREKWPVPPVTESEIAFAGSVELATKVKRDKYDKCVREWFHNSTRALISNAGSRSILKITPKPKMLQAWQAYHALTYESKWKPHVNKEWKHYKEEWEAEHPNEKPPKTRFEIMNTFMKAKFESETEGVKNSCEEYRKNLREEGTPVPGNSESTRNRQFQTAINKLPKTLASWGKAIMDQTGWHVTVLVGGPCPDNNGRLMTYLSHTGKNKEGESFEKFLGTKDYDEHMLIPFERFLHSSFTQEECDARRLASGEIADTKEESEADSEVEKGKERDENESKENEEANEKSNPTSLSDYNLMKQKNVDELKKIVDDLKAQYPISDLEPKQVSKKPVSKRKKNVANDSAVPRRESQRNKGKSSDLTADNTEKTSEGVNDTAIPTSSDALLKPSIAVTIVQAVLQSSPLPARSTAKNLDTPISNSESAPSDIARESLSTSVPTGTNNAHPSSDVLPGSSDVLSIGANTCHQAEHVETPPCDVTMQDASLPPKPRNDKDLPAWLIKIIKYLRDVSKDTPWQDLNLPTTLRPQEVTDWIRSKKKDVAPPVKPDLYGKRFMDWWRLMQPSWRMDGDGVSPIRETPCDETWQVLRKGGTSGIYVVVMGLSWWIKAQAVERDIDAWSVVDDISWVIEEMKQQAKQVPAKRAHDGVEDEAQPKKNHRRSK